MNGSTCRASGVSVAICRVVAETGDGALSEPTKMVELGKVTRGDASGYVPRPVQHVGGAGGLRTHQRDVVFGAAASLVSALVSYLTMFVVRGASIREPLAYRSDGLFTLMIGRSIEQNGWYLRNSSLGYPYGQDLRDLPIGQDNLILGVLKVFMFLFAPAQAINVVYVFGAVVIAVAAFVAFRKVMISAPVAAVLAVVFANLPAWAVRSTLHLPLSSYWALPLGGAVALTLMRIGGLRRREDDPVSMGWSVPALGVIVVVVASSGSYYAMFTLVAVTIAALYGWWSTRRVSVLTDAGVFGLTVVVLSVANVLPTIIHWFVDGRPPGVVERTPAESVRGALRLWDILAPARHLLSPTRREDVDDVEIAGVYLGAVPTLTLLAAVGVAVVWLVRRRRRAAAGADAVARQEPAVHALVLVVGCAVVASPHSFSYLLALSGFTFIRVWSRISVLVSFFLLVALGRWLQQWRADRSRPWRWQAALLAALAALSLVDLWPYIGERQFDEDLRARWSSDQAFYGQMAQSLPRGTAVVTIPFHAFPEVPGLGGTGAYDPASGYIHAPSLKWDFGAIESSVPPPPANYGGGTGFDVACYARSLRADAIVFDRWALPRENDNDNDLWSSLQETLGGPAGVSPNQRYGWFDLRAWPGDCRKWSDLVAANGWPSPFDAKPDPDREPESFGLPLWAVPIATGSDGDGVKWLHGRIS